MAKIYVSFVKDVEIEIDDALVESMYDEEKDEYIEENVGEVVNRLERILDLRYDGIDHIETAAEENYPPFFDWNEDRRPY